MEQEQALQNSPIQLDTIYLENSLATTPKLSSLVIALQSKEIHADLESIVENKLLLIDNIAIVLHHQNKEISFNIAQLNELEKYVIEDLLNFLAKAEKLMDRFASEKAHIDYQQTVGPLLAFLESMTEKSRAYKAQSKQ
ncbi:MAG: hypothetical protein HWD59_10320 [Coxiellaceae bacterium]|nr:MAG: hypothetical protein HWD59_10320 [Coxiellaceae bacterium]